MSSTLIEQCFYVEDNEEYFISTERSLIVIDPYLIGLDDLKKSLLSTKPGYMIPIRMRRPAWGRRMIDKAIKVIKY